MPTCLAGRYRIQALVGAGGMGTVYRAHDELLDEVVAVKVLAGSDESAAADRRRFLREVKLARRVTHPNVVRTYDVGEHDGFCFLTMELVEGASLAGVVRAEGRLTTGRVASIGTRIASGLAASHAAGVVHADLKPDNVICAVDGRVVITDFGVARAMRWALAKESEGSDELPMGTLPYMAPEQISGARDIDGRADIYALGCILYRLATGRRAWPKGSSPLERLVGPPADPRRVVPEVEPALAATILRCLAPDPSDRFQLAKEVAVELETLASGDGGSAPSMGRRSARKKAVAVLPLENHGDPGDAYLAFGLAERVCEYLAGNPALRVRSFGASCSEALRSTDVRSIGRALGVDAVVHGVLLAGPSGVGLGLGLLGVSDGVQIAVVQADSTRSGASSAVDELSLELESALLVEPTGAPRRRLDHRVEEAFQRGRYILATQYYATEAALPYLREAFEGAPEDPSVAATFALCVLRDARLGEWSSTRIEHARDAIRRAHELHPDAPELAAVLGALLLEGGHYRDAATSLCQARKMGPENPLVLDWCGRMVLEAGDPVSATEYLLKAYDTDPAQASLEVALARASFYVGDTEDALILCRRRASGDVYSSLHVAVLARLVSWTMDRDAAARELRRLESVHAVRAGRGDVSSVPGTIGTPEIVLRVAASGRLDDRAEEYVSGLLVPSDSSRRDAFRLQLAIEALLSADEVSRARSYLPRLEATRLFDATWLDRCPLLERLLETPEYRELRAATAERAQPVLDVFFEASTAPSTEVSTRPIRPSEGVTRVAPRG